MSDHDGRGHLAALEPGVVGVAYSGGLDSTALLYATAVAARDAGLRVLALHVHHGLQAQADAWWDHARAQCAAWAAQGLPVEFCGERLRGAPAPGESVEAWARAARYEALAAMARGLGCRLVLLGHHQRDQAETFLIQALRGAGVAGLSGMPAEFHRQGVTWARPWLRRSPQEIGAYARAMRLTHIEDPSNLSREFIRNRVRHDVLPVLEAHFAAVQAALSQSAAWAAQADSALQAYVDQDLAVLACDAGVPANGRTDQPVVARGGAAWAPDVPEPVGALNLEPWLTWSAARQSAVLRRWLYRHTGQLAPASLVVRLMRELPDHPAGRWPCHSGELRRHRNRLQWFKIGEGPHSPLRMDGSDRLTSHPSRRAPESRLVINGPGVYALPSWRGAIVVGACHSPGEPCAIDLSKIREFVVRPRRGGESFTASANRPPRCLKKQFQAAGIAAWARAVPLIYSGDELVFVPGLGFDARCHAVVQLGGDGPTSAGRTEWVQLQWLPEITDRQVDVSS